MSRLADARTALHDALSHVFDASLPPDGAQFNSGRVHAYPPQTVAAPCVWIEQSAGAMRTVGQLGTALVDAATFPVVVVYDGADRAQVAGSDELVARVWDAARIVGEPQAWNPQPLDVGGPTLRATVIDVDMTIGATTLCGRTVLAPEVVHV